MWSSFLGMDLPQFSERNMAPMGVILSPTETMLSWNHKEAMGTRDDPIDMSPCGPWGIWFIPCGTEEE